MRKFFSSHTRLKKGLLALGIICLVGFLLGGLVHFFQPARVPSAQTSMRTTTPGHISSLLSGFVDTTATVTPVTPSMTPNPSATISITPTVSPVPSATVSTTPTATASVTPAPLPHFDHIVIVIEENHNASEIIGSSDAPYLNALAAQGTLFTNAHGVTHPSQPNYLDLYSGSDQGVTDDSCVPSLFAPPDLGGQLLAAKDTFAGYAEGLPAPGDTSCTDTATDYARKHVPWSDFTDTAGATTNLPYSSFPTTVAGYATLPTVSFVIPDLNDDMHDGTVQQGDSWLQQNLDGYVQWAKTNNSLFIVTWDENDVNTGEATNQIPTIFVGQHVQVGTNATNINHFNVLRTIEDIYGLTPINNAASSSDITGVWN